MINQKTEWGSLFSVEASKMCHGDLTTQIHNQGYGGPNLRPMKDFFHSVIPDGIIPKQLFKLFMNRLK